MQKDNATEIFEQNQSNLEMAVENLSELVSLDTSNRLCCYANANSFRICSDRETYRRGKHL